MSRGMLYIFSANVKNKVLSWIQFHYNQIRVRWVQSHTTNSKGQLPHWTSSQYLGHPALHEHRSSTEIRRVSSPRTLWWRHQHVWKGHKDTDMETVTTDKFKIKSFQRRWTDLNKSKIVFSWKLMLREYCLPLKMF